MAGSSSASTESYQNKHSDIQISSTVRGYHAFRIRPIQCVWLDVFPERNNPYDPTAVGVWFPDIGKIPATMHQLVTREGNKRGPQQTVKGNAGKQVGRVPANLCTKLKELLMTGQVKEIKCEYTGDVSISTNPPVHQRYKRIKGKQDHPGGGGILYCIYHLYLPEDKKTITTVREELEQTLATLAEKAEEVTYHIQLLSCRCRICCCEISDFKRCREADDFQNEILDIWNVNIALDREEIHPHLICMKCRRTLERHQACMEKNKKLKTDKEIHVFTEHDESICNVCFSPSATSVEHSYATTTKEGERQTSCTCNRCVVDTHTSETQTSVTQTTTVSTQTLPSFTVDIETCDVSELSSTVKQKITKNIFCEEAPLIERDYYTFDQTYKTLSNCVSFNPEEYYRKRNPILQSAIDGLELGSKSNPTIATKIMSIEQLYGLVCSNFVAPFSFMVTLLLYAVSGSKLVVSILAKISPSGSWSTLRRWLGSLSKEEIKLPEGDLGLAFDNDQIIQKQYGVKAGGKPRVSILTSVCYSVLGMTGRQKKQNLSPSEWMVYCETKVNNAEKERIKQKMLAEDKQRAAFSIVRKEMKRRTQAALEEIAAQQFIEEGCVVDDIDKRVREIQKKKDTKNCPACDAEMKKTARKCPNVDCRANFKEASEKLSGKESIGTKLVKPPSQNSQMKATIVKISATADDVYERHGEDNIYSHIEPGHPDQPVPVFCGEPIFVNPNTYQSVIEVLNAIGEAGNISYDSSETSNNTRKWLKVTMDGMPYMLARNIITDTYHCVICAATIRTLSNYEKHVSNEHPFCPLPRPVLKFGWTLLSPGKLHIEMNMIRNYFAANWNVFLSDLAYEMGFSSDRAQQYAKSGSDHHIAWQLINIAVDGNIRELLIPYVRERISKKESMSVNDFIEFASKATDPNYNYLFEQTYRYGGAILVYRMGVRLNRPDLIHAATLVFSPFWSKSKDSKYQLIDLFDRADRAMMPEELVSFLDKTESISVSGNPYEGEDMDARLEEINKASKRWAAGAMFAHEWTRTFRNLDKLTELRHKMENILKLETHDHAGRQPAKKEQEVMAWRTKLRQERYLTTPHDTKAHVNLQGTNLDKELIHFTNTCEKNMQIVLDNVILGGMRKADVRDKLQQVFVTIDDRKKNETLESKTKAQITKLASDTINRIINDDAKYEYGKRLEEARKVRKQELIELYKEIDDFYSLETAELIAKMENE